MGTNEDSELVTIIKEESFERDVLHHLSDMPERYCSNYERKVEIHEGNRLSVTLERCMKCYKCFCCFKRLNKVYLMKMKNK